MALPIPVVEMDAPSPATAVAGTRKSCAAHSSTNAPAKQMTAPSWRRRAILGLPQTELVHHDMKAVYLRGESLGNFNCERFHRLRQQSAVDVAVRHPYDFAVVVVKTGNHMGNVHRLPTLIQQVAAQNALALNVGVDFLIHHPNHRVC